MDIMFAHILWLSCWDTPSIRSPNMYLHMNLLYQYIYRKQLKAGKSSRFSPLRCMTHPNHKIFKCIVNSTRSRSRTLVHGRGTNPFTLRPLNFGGITTNLPIPNADALRARDIGSYITRIGNTRVHYMDAGLLFRPWVGHIAKPPPGFVKPLV